MGAEIAFRDLREFWQELTKRISEPKQQPEFFSGRECRGSRCDSNAKSIDFCQKSKLRKLETGVLSPNPQPLILIDSHRRGFREDMVRTHAADTIPWVFGTWAFAFAFVAFEESGDE